MSSIFEQAKQRHAAGELLEAETLYRQAATGEPEAYKSLNNLGTVLEEQGRLDEAVLVYQQGVAVAPECFLLCYNLGHALHRSQRLNEAFLVYVKAIQLDPDSFETHYNIGNLLLDQGRYGAAIEAFQRAIQLQPQREIYSNLGAAYVEEQRLEEAAAAYRKAIAMEPDEPIEHFHLGRVMKSMCQYSFAIESYQRAIELDAAFSAAYAHLILLLQELQRDHEVEAVFGTWHLAVPGDPVAQHMWASYSRQDIPDRASDEYLRAIFDEFASDYDLTMSQHSYRSPVLLSDRLLWLASQSMQVDILDAGCGTGLCGPLVRSHAKHLVGLDLSRAMLEKARLRGCYDELFESELTSHLRENPARYDVIIAADTLIYFGDLTSVILNATHALRRRGSLLFTIELLQPSPEGIVLNLDFDVAQNGRYRHAWEYVRQLLQRAGLEVQSADVEVVRREGGRAVKACIVSARKP